MTDECETTFSFQYNYCDEWETTFSFQYNYCDECETTFNFQYNYCDECETTFSFQYNYYDEYIALVARVVVTGSLFARKSDKVQMDEAMALQVAQMIINDVNTTTRSHDRASQGHDPHSRGHGPASQGHNPASQGRDPHSRGHGPASQGHNPASQGRDPHSRGHDLSSSSSASFQLWQMGIHISICLYTNCGTLARHIAVKLLLLVAANITSSSLAFVISLCHKHLPFVLYTCSIQFLSVGCVHAGNLVSGLYNHLSNYCWRCSYKALGLMGLALYLVDWPTVVLQCFDTVGWVFWHIKSSPIWHKICLVDVKPYSSHLLTRTFRRAPVNVHKWLLMKMAVCPACKGKPFRSLQRCLTGRMSTKLAIKECLYQNYKCSDVWFDQILDRCGIMTFILTLQNVNWFEYFSTVFSRHGRYFVPIIVNCFSHLPTYIPTDMLSCYIILLLHNQNAWKVHCTYLWVMADTLYMCFCR